jgi:tripartite-type tricarboxylate transporter receptor subunit TctC
MKNNLLTKFFSILIMIAASLMIPQPRVLAGVAFPTRPLSIWVGMPPGGGTDIIIRTLAEEAENSLGQKIVIINKPGGGQTVAASLLTKEKPDGYTIAGLSDIPFTKAPHLRDVDYDPFQDFTFIMRVGSWKALFVVKENSPFKKWEDVVDWAKKNPGQLIYGHPGAATTVHLAMIKIGIKEGFTYKSVPFNGDTPTISALLGGHVMIAGSTSLGVRSHIEAKTIRGILAIERELDYAPDIPTFRKVHYDFGIIPSSIIICAPKGIPDPIRQMLEKAFINGMKAETFKRIAKDQELLMDPLIGKALLDYIKRSHVLFEGFIKEAGIYKIEKK